MNGRCTGDRFVGWPKKPTLGEGWLPRLGHLKKEETAKKKPTKSLWPREGQSPPTFWATEKKT